MNQSDLFLVVMAGGSGTRFWPKSTSKRPKQLLSFQVSKESKSETTTLLSQTLARFKDWVPPQQRVIVTTQFLEEAVKAETLKEVKILAEPQGRNTAPCIYWAARHIADQNPKAVMLVMPSDHLIANSAKFVATAQFAAQWAAENNDLVTLGIQPTRPETGYGYLKTGEILQGRSKNSKDPYSVRQVEAFVEKPNSERALEYVSSERYLWNGGMFLWRVDTVLQAFDEFMPEMKRAWDLAKGNIQQAYPQMTATSIDYGIMERASNVVTVPLDCGWDDLGNWTSVETVAKASGALQGDNVLMEGDLLSVESSRNIVDTPNRFVALLGVEDLIIVEQGESLLVAHKDKAQDIRKVVDELKKRRPDLV